MEEKLSTSGLDGSGQRAMKANEEAIAGVEKKMEVLRQRAANGEIVDDEVRKLKKLSDALKEDRGRIQQGGM